MQFLAKVYVSLKPTVNDPQGRTVLGALKNLGFAGVAAARVGKYLELTLDAPDPEAASDQVREMCRQLLANPVTEQFHFVVEERAPAQKPSA